MNERRLFQNGITLIALVISIIVMLILAGVSLNATIGDNGIITQAQNATYMQSIAALEEYLQTEYVKYYDFADEYNTKVELLVNKDSDLFLTDGSKKYVTYNGNMHYLINKLALPDDVKNQLKGGDGGDTQKYANYIRLQDVYGITSDLKVYYCKNSESVMGNTENLAVDPDTPLKKINGNSELKSAISSALEEIGITVGEKGITVGNVNSLKSLTLDGSKCNITNLNGISELTVLQDLTLKNLTLSNLNGIESCNMLKKIYFVNSKITDSNGYEKLGTVLDLQKLYLYFNTNFSESDSNSQIEKLGIGLSTATNLKKLEYFGIFGTEGMINEKAEFSYDSTDGKYAYSQKIYSNVTNISSLNNFADNIKQSIKVMYLNNNKVNSLECLSNFFGIEELDIMNNTYLKNLSGLLNHTNIKYILAQNTGIENIEGLEGCNKIETAIFSNSNLVSINGLKSENLKMLDVKNSKITNIEALANNINLTYLQLENNTELTTINSIKKCNKINNLYLGGNTKLDETVLSSSEFQNIIKQCGVNYSLDGKYGLLFLNQEKVDLTNSNLTDNNLELLRGKTNIKGIKLTGNPNLSNEKIEEILGSLTNLECISLYNVSQSTSINFVKNQKNLIELDLRGTNVSDLSILENLANENKLTLGCLFIDNSNINITNIQNTINSVSQKKVSNQYTFVEKDGGGVSQTNGIIIANKSLLAQFRNCTNIIYFCNYVRPDIGMGNTEVDLSNCKNLKKVTARGYNVKFVISSSCESIHLDASSTMPDLTNCEGLKSISISWTSQNISMDEILKKISKATQLSNFGCVNIKDEELNNFDNLKYTKVNSINLQTSGNLKKINIKSEVSNITSLSLENCSSFQTIDTFEKLTNLKTLNLNYTKVQNLEYLRNNTTLNKFYANNSFVNSLEPLTNINALEVLKCSNSKLSSLQGIENMQNLENLDVSNNSISNLYYLSKLLEKGSIKLNNLNLANNLLENNASISVNGKIENVNNVEIIKNLYKAGLRNIDISGNDFSDTSEIKNLNWDSYKE